MACTPGAGWEKGQVEKQVADVRGRLFVPSPRGRSYAEINAWLMDRCSIGRSARVGARRRQEADAPDDPGQDGVAGVRRGAALPDGVPRPLRRLPCQRSVAVSKTCLVRLDNNQYSVSARAVGRPVDVRAYADRIVIRQDGEIVAEHPAAWRCGARMSARRPRRDRLRSVALRADPDEEARGVEERRALQGLAVARRARPPADPALRPRRRRSAVREDPGCSSGGRAGGGRDGLRRGARLRRLQRRRRALRARGRATCSTSSPGSASRHRRRTSRRPRACGFATSRWPIAGATTA